MSKLLRRLRYWFRQRKMDAELAEEMEFHRAMLAGDAAARTAMARLSFG